jgi:hypothetical protein
MSIEVHVAGRGRVRDGAKIDDDEQVAHCDLCGTDTDVVVSTTRDGTGPFGCRGCLRSRLEATTLAVYVLQEPGPTGGLPWGKISG